MSKNIKLHTSDLVKFVPGLILLWGVAHRVWGGQSQTIIYDTVKLKTVGSAIYLLLTSNFANIEIAKVRDPADDKVYNSDQE